MKNQKGFTLIELIMVIVILGILAATALPRFVDLGADARRASIQGVEGAMRSASAMAHAASIVAASSVVTIEGTAYTLVNGYPAAADIVTLAGVNGGNFTITGGTVQATGAATPASCQVSYTAPAAAGQAPTIAAVTTGC